MQTHTASREIIPCAVPNSKRFVNVLGQTFGRLTVTKLLGRYANHPAYIWECQCACGNTAKVSTGAMTSRNQESCGCLRRETNRLRLATHGRSRTREYETWCRMWARCNNRNHHHYANYGGRGIAVCDRWKDFANFYADMGPKPSAKHSIDRIDNDGNYEPGNCRWATQRQQQRNRRDNLRITFKGETMTLMEWSERYDLVWDTLRGRLERGWTVEEALTIRPDRTRRLIT